MLKNPIKTIDSSQGFLSTLVKWIQQNYTEISQCEIYLPNRRSCRQIKTELLKYSNNNAAILPKIEAIGDLTEEDTIFLSDKFTFQNTISHFEQQIILTKLIMKWEQGTYSPTKAAQLALELIKLLNEIEKEQIHFDRIKNMVPENLAVHWEKTLDFLNIVFEHWPKILKDKNAINAIALRNLACHIQAGSWIKNKPTHPIIIAGSTGSNPATAELMKAVSKLGNGHIILPGVDMEMSDEIWDGIEATHPQYGLKLLLGHIKVERKNIVEITPDSATAKKSRKTLISMAMLPSQFGHMLHNYKPVKKEAIENITYLELNTDREEALVVAAIMRSKINEKGKKIACVTQDRLLARRISNYLEKWGIIARDSAGQVLANTPTAIYIRMTAELLNTHNITLKWLSCLKHPHSALGVSRNKCRENVRIIEKEILSRQETTNFDAIFTDIKGASELKQWLQNSYKIIKPLIKLRTESTASIEDILKTHITCIEKMADSNTQKGVDKLWSTDEGKTIKNTLEELVQHAASFGVIKIRDYPDLLSYILKQQVYRDPLPDHPRLAILSPMEARLNKYDTVILSGLNEGVWPETSQADAWMSRAMRQKTGLPEHEKKIGLSAHDFSQLLSQDEVILTRSKKTSGVQTITSRWILRLETVLKINKLAAEIKPRKPWQSWLEQLYSPEDSIKIEIPKPMPPLNRRPVDFSVTDIEKLMRNPYSIYAKKILGLKPLNEIEKEAGQLEFGNFLHKTLEKYVVTYPAKLDGAAYTRLFEIGKNELKKYEHMYHLWWPKFETIANWIYEQECKRREKILHIYSEKQANATFAEINKTLTCKADRVEISNDKTLTIIDYKTGSIPSDKDIELGYAPQLPLEAVILSKINISEPNHKIIELEYWKIAGNKNEQKKVKNVSQQIKDAEKGVTKVLAKYKKTSTPYLASPIKQKAPKYDDYEHLSRKKEWESYI